VSASEDVEVDGAKALLYRDAPSWEGLPTAAIGAFACADEKSGRALLDKAKALLRDQGFEALIGPMDGDTWHRYRLVSESDGSPPFAMEPVSGPDDKAAFVSAGFAPISEYVSSRARLADAAKGDPPATSGVAITAWDGQAAEALIGRMFEMSLAGFANNRFFRPITREAFLKLYEPVMPLVDPRFVLFAHAPDRRLIGFLFGFPDRLEGAAAKTVVLKTYASGVRGVGHALADSFHRRAIELGYVDVIHALMHVDNVSRERSGRHGATIFRHYALMGARL
jgi:hypothetical protein